jgi:hypothetical protein
MKIVTKIIIGVDVLVSVALLFILYGLNLMTIEDKYGGFQEL